jgi:hypothetical protein
LEQLATQDWNAIRGLPAQFKTHFGASFQLALTAGKFPNAKLRSRQIQQNGYRFPNPLRHFPDSLNASRVRGMVAVRRVDARDVHSSPDQLFQHTWWVRRRS